MNTRSFVGLPSAMAQPTAYNMGTPAPQPAPHPTYSSMSSYGQPPVPQMAPSMAAPAPVMGGVPSAVPSGGQAGGNGLGNMMRNTFVNPQGGINFEGVGNVASGLGALGSVWAAFQANKVANKSLDFQQQAYKTNLANQTNSFNMALTDRAKARGAQMGQDPSEVAAYISRYSMGK